MNIIQYLEDKKLDPKTKGKNVTNGWVNIKCIFCDDHSNHLGINLKSLIYSCWLCGKSGHVNYLIQKIEKCYTKKANLIIQKYSEDEPEYEVQEKYYQSKVIYPKEITDVPKSDHIKYLKKRRFNYKKLINKYDIKFGGCFGRYRNTIVAPIHINHKEVAFITRNIYKKEYLKSSSKECIVNPNHIVYNIDNIFSDTIIIVEGIFDVFRIGDGSVALLTTAYSTEQIKFLKNYNIKNIYILFDSEEKAIKKAEELGNFLSLYFNVFILTNNDFSDPCNMTNIQVKELRDYVFR